MSGGPKGSAASRARRTPPWDLTALLNAADPRASLPERHLWMVRLLEWLRHAPLTASAPSEAPRGQSTLLRLRHLLNVLEREPEHRARVGGVLARFWAEVDCVALYADFGFSPRMDFFGEFAGRLRAGLLPISPATSDLAELFGLLFPSGADARWLEALDEATLVRIVTLVEPEVRARARADEVTPADHHTALLDAIVFLAAAVGAAGFSSQLRRRMSPELLAEAPFRQLTRVAERVAESARAHDQSALLREAQYLRALLDTCRRCADSVHEHLAEHGVSVHVVFALDQLRERTYRIEELLNCVLSPQPARDFALLLAHLARTADERRSVRALFAQHYSLLARKVAERSAETGQHYIARDRGEYAHLLRTAAGGGALIGITTLLKFALLALGLSAFWGGFAIGVNYAIGFALVHMLGWTIATKQPAMTAPTMAEKLGDVASDDELSTFVDEVTLLIRSQAAGIFGNVAAVVPVVLAVQWLSQLLFGRPAVGPLAAEHVLESLTLWGPTLLYAAFTGVLLFASSLIAGWAENWFVWHRLDSAIAWNPRIVARLGAARAQRWARYWRANISGYASNVSLGLMLGLVPALAAFFGLPIEVRHVTLSSGQLAAAVGTEGVGLLLDSAFWWCVVATALTAALNVGVSFYLAFKVAMRSRGIRVADLSRIYRAIRHKMFRRPTSFVLPPTR